MTVVLSVSIICTACIIIWSMFLRLARSFWLSRSHLHSFNRRAETIVNNQMQHINDYNSDLNNRLDNLEAEIRNIKNIIALKGK